MGADSHPAGWPDKGIVVRTRQSVSDRLPSQRRYREDSARWTRREFLRFGVVGGVVALGIQAAAFLYATLFPRRVPRFGSRIVAGDLREFTADSAPERVVAGKFFLASFPAGLLAIYWRCRHLGCDVPWYPSDTATLPNGREVTGIFRCPCHNSTYTRDGQVIAGPAPGPLDIFTIEVDAEGRVIVDTGEIWRRPVSTLADLTPAQPATSGPPNREKLTRVGPAV